MRYETDDDILGVDEFMDRNFNSSRLSWIAEDYDWADPRWTRKAYVQSSVKLWHVSPFSSNERPR